VILSRRKRQSLAIEASAAADVLDVVVVVVVARRKQSAMRRTRRTMTMLNANPSSRGRMGRRRGDGSFSP